MAIASNEYVLGTGIDELERLSVQHRLWADALVAACRRAGVGDGSRVIDLGCGPGYATMDIADLVGARGQVLAIDESSTFLDHVREIARRTGRTNVETAMADAHDISRVAMPASFDAAYTRWTLCWLARPEAAVRSLAAALRPGGRLIIHDYFNWQSMTLAPRSAALSRVIAGALQSFIDRQGNTDIAGDLLAMLDRAGMDVTHFDVHARAARGGGHDSTIDWPVQWWRTYAPKLVALGKIDRATCDEALRDIDDLTRNPGRFCVCPPVYEFIATKRRA